MNDDTPALRIENLRFTYPHAATRDGTNRPALDGVTLTVPCGERLGILGPNGGGKSTLLKLVLGLLGGYEGRIEVFGRSPKAARKAGLVGYLPQRNEAELAFPISVRQAVMLGATAQLSPWRGPSDEMHRGVERALELVGVADLAERPVGALSGGQLQRVMIARAVAHGPRMLVLDEPTVGVDVAGQRRFADLIEHLHRELGLTVIVVSHDLRAVAATSDQVACLSRTLHYHASPSGLTPQVLAEVFSHDVEAVFGAVHVNAHAAADCNDPSHAHTHDHADHNQGDAPGTGTP